MATDTTSKIGFAFEATAETDPIDSNSAAYWKFGVITQGLKFDHPSETMEWTPLYANASQRTPSTSQLNRTYVKGGVVYYPVNLVPLRMVMSNASTHSATAGEDNEHTIDNINSGNLDTFTVRSEMTGGTDSKFKCAVGSKASRVHGMIFPMSDFRFLSERLEYNAIKTLISDGTLAECSLDAAHNGRKYPTKDGTMTGTEVNDRYDWGTSTPVFTWDGDSFVGDVFGFQYDIINNQTLGFVDNQAELEYIDEGNYQFLFGFDIVRGNAKEIQADFHAESPKTMVLKIWNTTTYYREFTWTNARLVQCVLGHYGGEEGEYPLYHFSGYAEDLQIKGKDGLAATAAQNAFYGESL